jgi:hypothetical protein
MARPPDVPDALDAEIARVTALRAQYAEATKIAKGRANFASALFLMDASLKAATAAAASRDLVAQILALEDLEGYGNG